MNLVLAVDAATDHAGLALISSLGVTGERTWSTRHNQTVELLPRLEEMLTQTGVTTGEIGVIGVCRGPGSYNGVRVGMSVAKGLAAALNKPVVGVSTLSAEAGRYHTDEADIWAVLPLGRDYAVAGFVLENSKYINSLPEQAMTGRELCDKLPQDCLVVGELPERLVEVLKTSRPDVRLSGRPLFSRAVALGYITFEGFDRGLSETAGTLRPAYLRRPQITPPNKPLDLTGVPSAGVIWDMDGVIIDSADLHFASWQEVLNSYGYTMDRTRFDETFGRRNDDIVTAVAGEPVPQDRLSEIGRAKEEAFRRLIKGHLRAFPGVVELIKSLRESGFVLAIASSAPPENVSLILRELGLTDYFSAVIDGEQVSRGKPDPEVFLKAADALGLKPIDCVVIEDAVAGVTAARSAGMAVLAVSNTHSAASLAGADRVTETLQTIDAATVLELIQNNKTKE